MAKKRLYYVPQFYLEGFLDNSCIWAYKKGTDKIFSTDPKNVALQTHYYNYTVETVERKMDSDSFEEAFSKIENGVAPIITKISKRENINGEEKNLIANFIVLQILHLRRKSHCINLSRPEASPALVV